MSEQPTTKLNSDQDDRDYRDYFKNRQGCIITVGNLFEAVKQDHVVAEKVDLVLSKKEPVTILVEGSAFEQNIDVLDAILARRGNGEDSIILIDVSQTAVNEHVLRIQNSFPVKKYHAIRADMNHVPLATASVDIVINDCAVNFNTSTEDNEQTVKEVRRLLRPTDSVSLFSVVINSEFDDPKYGQDQELLPPNRINEQGVFYPLPGKPLTRLAWPVPYYKNLFHQAGLEYVEYGIDQGKKYFAPGSKTSFRRFLLTNPPSSN